jgi:hypothetical protein
VLREEAKAADAEIKQDIDALKTTAKAMVDAIQRMAEDLKERAEAKARDIDRLVREVIADAEIDLPEAVLPEFEFAEKPPGSVLIATEWTWVEQTFSMKARKSYGDDEDED